MVVTDTLRTCNAQVTVLRCCYGQVAQMSDEEDADPLASRWPDTSMPTPTYNLHRQTTAPAPPHWKTTTANDFKKKFKEIEWVQLNADVRRSTGEPDDAIAKSIDDMAAIQLEHAQKAHKLGVLVPAVLRRPEVAPHKLRS